MPSHMGFYITSNSSPWKFLRSIHSRGSEPYIITSNYLCLIFSTGKVVCLPPPCLRKENMTMATWGKFQFSCHSTIIHMVEVKEKAWCWWKKILYRVVSDMEKLMHKCVIQKHWFGLVPKNVGFIEISKIDITLQ